MNKIPCELIRDLFPSYIDELTSDTSNSIIEEHISECPECSDILGNMRTEYNKPYSANENEKKEINFLKKYNSKNKRIIIGSIAVIAVITALFLLRTYVIGSNMTGRWFWYNVTVSGKDILFDAKPNDDSLGMASVSYSEEDGIVTMYTKAVTASPLHSGEFHSEYTSSSDISRILLNDRIVWSEGHNISEYTSEVYNTAHDFMGDMAANNETAQAIDISKYLGPYENKLNSSKKPYGWVIKLQNKISRKNHVKSEKYMKAIAYTALAMVGNLDEVIFEYDTDYDEPDKDHFGPEVKKYTTDTASYLIGQDIKNCSKDINLLHELLVKVGLENE